MSPKLIQSAVWTWDKNEPTHPFPCTVMKSNGFWGTVECSEKLPFACQSIHNPLVWKIDSNYLAPFHSGAKCEIGHQFGLPSNPYWGQFLNATLHEVKVSRVWINLLVNSTTFNHF